MFVEKLRPTPSIIGDGGGNRSPNLVALAQASLYCPACCKTAAESFLKASPFESWQSVDLFRDGSLERTNETLATC